jgi:hypothetical protein
MDGKLTESMNENNFGKDGDEGEGHSDRQMGQGENKGDGQTFSDEMIQSVGPDESGASLLADEVGNIPGTLAVKPFKITPPELKMSEVLNLDKLLELIELCGLYRYIIVNATADKAKVVVKTQNALFEVLKLCDATSLIVQNFQTGANNIMEKLRIAYLYLQDGFPDFAITDIEATSKDVAMMRGRCENTLSKIPGDEYPSMDATIRDDLDERRSVLVEKGIEHSTGQANISNPEIYHSSYSSATPSVAGVGDSYADVFLCQSDDEMQISFEEIKDGPKSLDEYARLVEEDKAQGLKEMSDSVERKLSSIPEDGAQSTNDDGCELETVSVDVEGESCTSLVYVPSIEKIIEMIAKDEAKRWVLIGILSLSGGEAVDRPLDDACPPPPGVTHQRTPLLLKAHTVGDSDLMAGSFS